MRNVYEIVIRLETDDDGLVSMQIIKTRDITPHVEDDDDSNEDA